MRAKFEKDLVESQYLHRLLPLHFEDSLEANWPDKTVLDSLVIYDKDHCLAEPRVVGAEATTRPGIGNLTNDNAEPPYEAFLEKNEDGTLTMSADIRAGRAIGAIAEIEQTNNLEHAEVEFTFGEGMDWRGYNRLHYKVKPAVDGVRILFAITKVHNEGEVAVPDRFDRTGECVQSLITNEWNDVFFEFDDMPRDKVTKLRLFTYLIGRDYLPAAKDLVFIYKDITLEKVAEPEHERGWMRKDDKIMFSTGGYRADGGKTAVSRVTEGCFQLIDFETGVTVFSDEVKKIENENGCFGVLDFTPVTKEGTYKLKLGGQETREFEISSTVEKESVWKVMNFIYGERCGFPVPGHHGACHLDNIVWRGNLGMSAAGGWHDAGDQSQQVCQSSEIMVGLLMNAMKYKDTDKQLYLRLMEEAMWGFDMVIRTRFGDGYRMISIGQNHFTDNMIVLNDTSRPGHVSNASINNFIMSGAEAVAAKALEDYDPELAKVALTAAREDYEFADARFREVGVETDDLWGHVKTTPYSGYCAIAAWSASLLLELTGDKDCYEERAKKYAAEVLACQDCGEAGLPFTGFFYRDKDKRIPVHWNHQSREYTFVQALAECAKAMPDAPELAAWEDGMKRYGEYLKAVKFADAPYGMAPSGIHTVIEADDGPSFRTMHLIADPSKERDSYIRQLENGKKVADGWYVRSFPVWFSFRGNAAVQLASGMAAAIVGQYFGDKELMEIAWEQLYWDWGKNPFGQSIIYGVGTNYCREYALCCGELVGEIPVGMESYEDEDLPYWPGNNNCTYREVWIGPAARYLWLTGLL